MDEYESGNPGELETLLCRAREDAASGSIDLMDGLDLDFLAAMTDDDEREPHSYLETDTDTLSNSIHDFLKYNPSTEAPGATLRRMTFDTIFGGGHEDGSARQRAESLASIGIGYGLGDDMFYGEGSGTDSERENPFDLDQLYVNPYLHHAESLEAQGKLKRETTQLKVD
jgi:hypothetical protein